MLQKFPRTLLATLTALPVSLALLSIIIFVYRIVSHWKMALVLVGISMAVLSIAALGVFIYWLVSLYRSSHSKMDDNIG